MISCTDFSKELIKNDLTFFSGVPDSTFKELINWISEDNKFTHRTSSNECEAIATAAGYNFATNKVGSVYLQNSGFGKTINPLTSLVSKEVYSIPMVLFIGYRGEKDKIDEPQHKMMGRLTIPLLEVLEIPYEILPANLEEAARVLTRMKSSAVKTNYATAIIIKKNTFKEELKNKPNENYQMTREEAIKLIVKNLDEDCHIISTTGKTSRELFEYRIANNQPSEDFLTVGSMGCSSAIALEVAIQKKDKKIFCFDGDGATIMQMGTLATIGKYKPKNLYHIIFDNNSYDSTGGQKTVSSSIDFRNISLSCGYTFAKTIEKREELMTIIPQIKSKEGPILLVIKIKGGSRKNLGRPTKSPIENKMAFTKSLK